MCVLIADLIVNESCRQNSVIQTDEIFSEQKNEKYLQLYPKI